MTAVLATYRPGTEAQQSNAFGDRSEAGEFMMECVERDFGGKHVVKVTITIAPRNGVLDIVYAKVEKGDDEFGPFVCGRIEGLT